MQSASNPFSIFIVFLKLGLTSFGGPSAHIGFFHKEFVTDKEWLSDHSFTNYLALCQFLPGPASSQLGFIIGFLRGGYLGAIAAFIGFTLPSIIALVSFALFIQSGFESDDSLMFLLTGLKWCAVVVVADALYKMFNQHCINIFTKIVFSVSTFALLFLPNMSHLLVLVTVFISGCFWRNSTFSQSPSPVTQSPISITTGVFSLLLFITLLLVAVVSTESQIESQVLLNLSLQFFQSGALVFGGGHVVLPMLEVHTVDAGYITPQHFTAGYGAAQLIPGPLFSFVSYLAVFSSEPNQIALTVGILTIALFLPGFLLIFSVVPFWQSVMSHPLLQSGVKAVNAAVVSILLVGFYDPIVQSAITGLIDVIACILGIALVFKYKLSVLKLASILCSLAFLSSLL